MKFFFLVTLLASSAAFGQTEEEKVKNAVNLLFDGMRKSDSNMIRAAFAPQAILQTITRNKEGKTAVRNEEINGFIHAVTQPHVGVYDERIQFELVRIDADLALVWTPYKFYVGEKFSHCGVNSFQLVRLNNEWKIQYIIDTRRREKCE